MSKYDEAYLRTMTFADFKQEPPSEVTEILLEHMQVFSDMKLSDRSIKKYSKIFFKYYKPEQLPIFLSHIARSSDIFDCINVSDPDFVVMFKYNVITNGDDTMRSLINGIMSGYGNSVVRHIIMFTWAYVRIKSADVRVLVDFFSGMNNLTNSQMKDCTRFFMEENWSTEKMIDYLTSNITLGTLYYKHTGNYGMYAKRRIQQSIKKQYDTFNPSKLPRINDKYKLDRRLFYI